MIGAIGGIIGGIGGIISGMQAAKERAKVREMIEKFGREGIDASYRGLDAQYDSLEALIQNAFDQELFSRASRVDPLGNRLYYDKDSNTWEYDLTPLQEQLFQASQDEQLRQLTTDSDMARAMRQYAYKQNLDQQAYNHYTRQADIRNQNFNRAIQNFARVHGRRAAQSQIAENERRIGLNRRIESGIDDTLRRNQIAASMDDDIMALNKRGLDMTNKVYDDNLDQLEQNKLIRDDNERIRQRMGDIGDEAMPDYRRAVAEYRYQQPPTEGAIRNDISRLIAQSMGSGDRLMKEYHDRSMARRSGNVPIIIGSAGGLPEETFGPQIAQVMLQARNQARDEAQGRSAAHENKYGNILQRLQAQLSLGGGAPGQFGSPAPILPNMPRAGVTVGPINRGAAQIPGADASMYAPMQHAQIPGGQDATGAAFANLNALETNMANAITNAMGVEANALNSGYGRIGGSYQNITNNFGNLIRGIASTMPSGGGGGSGGGGLGGILKGIGGMFGGMGG